MLLYIGRMKKLLLTGLLIVLSQSVFAQKDTVVAHVFKVLTTDNGDIKQPVLNHLSGIHWEALAYWDVNSPKELDQMFEAVGDIYYFEKDGTFLLQMIDPQKPTQFGLEISGTFTVEGNRMRLTSKAGKIQEWHIIWLDNNYLILEIDGLRIFYSKTRSYHTYD